MATSMGINFFFISILLHFTLFFYFTLALYVAYWILRALPLTNKQFFISSNLNPVRKSLVPPAKSLPVPVGTLLARGRAFALCGPLLRYFAFRAWIRWNGKTWSFSAFVLIKWAAKKLMNKNFLDLRVSDFDWSTPVHLSALWICTQRGTPHQGRERQDKELKGNKFVLLATFTSPQRFLEKFGKCLVWDSV